MLLAYWSCPPAWAPRAPFSSLPSRGLPPQAAAPGQHPRVSLCPGHAAPRSQSFSAGAGCRSGCPVESTCGPTEPRGWGMAASGRPTHPPGAGLLWSGSWLGPSRWRESLSFLPAASIPALWRCQPMRVCTGTLQGLGCTGSTPTSPPKVPHANMHRFCQHLCGVPAWGWAPSRPQHWAPCSLLEVLALHISGQGRRGMQDDAPCLGGCGVCPSTGPSSR